MINIEVQWRFFFFLSLVLFNFCFYSRKKGLLIFILYFSYFHYYYHYVINQEHGEIIIE